MSFLTQLLFDNEPSVSHYISPSASRESSRGGNHDGDGEVSSTQLEHDDDHADPKALSDTESVLSLDDNGIPSLLIFESAIRDSIRASMRSSSSHSLLGDANDGGTEDDARSFDGRTILSSAPSGFFATEEGAGPSTVGSGPGMVLATSPVVGDAPFSSSWLPFSSSRHPLSISTAESIFYSDLSVGTNCIPQGDEHCANERQPPETQLSLLSFHPSFGDSSDGRDEISSSCGSQASDATTSGSHRHVAIRDAWDERWYGRLQERANLVVRALTQKQHQQQAFSPTLSLATQWRSPPLPPIAPTLLTTSPTLSTDSSGQSPDASQWVPSCFICPLCQDVIVGSLTLDCLGCEQPVTVCTVCWEHYHATPHALTATPLNMADDLGYAVVPRPPRHLATCQSPCPRCQQPVRNTLYDYALDVAILELVHHALTPPYQEGCSKEHIQKVYFDRVNEWRAELVRRSQENGEANGMIQNDFAIAQLLQQDEEERCRWSNAAKTVPAAQFEVVAALTLVVAVLASVGLRVMAAQSIAR